MLLEEFTEALQAKRGAAIDKARDTSLPARYRETFAVRAEVYEEVLLDVDGIDPAPAQPNGEDL